MANVEAIDEQPYVPYEYNTSAENKSWAGALPVKQGLYDPENEKDACGVGFAAHIKGEASHKIVSDGRICHPPSPIREYNLLIVRFHSTIPLM